MIEFFIVLYTINTILVFGALYFNRAFDGENKKSAFICFVIPGTVFIPKIWVKRGGSM